MQQIAALNRFEHEIVAFRGAPADDRELLFTNIHSTPLASPDARLSSLSDATIDCGSTIEVFRRTAREFGSALRGRQGGISNLCR